MSTRFKQIQYCIGPERGPNSSIAGTVCPQTLKIQSTSWRRCGPVRPMFRWRSFSQSRCGFAAWQTADLPPGYCDRPAGGRLALRRRATFAELCIDGKQANDSCIDEAQARLTLSLMIYFARLCDRPNRAWICSKVGPSADLWLGSSVSPLKVPIAATGICIRRLGSCEVNKDLWVLWEWRIQCACD